MLANEFCWLCLGDWSKHGSATGGFYKCNIYEEKKKSGDLNEDEKAKVNKQKNNLFLNISVSLLLPLM